MDAGELRWSYANNVQIAIAFLGLAVLFFGIGVVVVVSFGNEAAMAGGSLLTVGVFVLIFSGLVFLPRVARRGAVSFSAFSVRSLDEAESAVREAIEASGHRPEVAVLRSRSGVPPRIVTAEGVRSRFRLETTRHAPNGASDTPWTEIIESFSPRDGQEALALRNQITERLSAVRPPA